MPGAQFTDITISLEAGERLLIPSDGITETLSRDHKDQIAERGVGGLLRRHAQAPGLALFEHLLNDLRAYQGADMFEDDVSAILIDYMLPSTNARKAA